MQGFKAIQPRMHIDLHGFDEIQDCPLYERWILSWGGDAMAIKPKQLVEAVKESAKKLLRA